jgi:hypothetical protein
MFEIIIIIPDVRVIIPWHCECELAKQKVLILVLVATDISEYDEPRSSRFKPEVFTTCIPQHL